MAGKLTTQIIIHPIAVDARTAAEILGGLGVSTFLAYVSRGRLPRPRKLGSRSMWLVEELVEAARAPPFADDTPLPRNELKR